tara:strand:+ start:366 stop:770 length:405 start_codon:yes stop_codon:yes gene_type:complete
MTKRIRAKHKVDRRLRVNLWGKPKSPFNTRNYPPGQHGQSKKGKPTDYGTQLNAKQKLKAYYGNINERQFRNIYRKAIKKRGDSTENLVGLLETRLDTVSTDQSLLRQFLQQDNLLIMDTSELIKKKSTFLVTE